MKNILILIVVFTSFLIQGCSNKATSASKDYSAAVREFKLMQRVIFYNDITDSYIEVIEGRCYVEYGRLVGVICKTSDSTYEQHYVSLSDNVTYFVEPLESAGEDDYRYKVTYKPLTISPKVDSTVKSKEVE